VTDLLDWAEEHGRDGPIWPANRTLARKRLMVSFSGGRTSAYMTWLILRTFDPAEWEIVVVFANTGCEHEETLRFVQRCDEYLGFGTVWLEVVPDPILGNPSGFRVVTFETASRNGEPFEAVIAKYGIPGPGFPRCTNETKLVPIDAYMRSIGWRNRSYQTAIGIRSDEMDRVSEKRKERRLIYPLLDANIDKAAVLAFWREQNFDLYLPEHMGNCVWCWKKSMRKHLTIAAEMPSAFDFPARMERDYPMVQARQGTPRRFFRGERSSADILKLAQDPFEPFVDGNHVVPPDGYDELDVGGGCGESCELY
jgi:3'-phosphoadenosine 5'-phosphosulfate sulfotransferase (PAPS reductase)/FAD synthetase